MSGVNHKSGRSTNNPEIMAAAIVGYRDGHTAAETVRQTGYPKDAMCLAYVVIRDAPELAERVLSGDLTIYKAHQTATKGVMVPCPVCSGKGHIFRRRPLRT